LIAGVVSLGKVGKMKSPAARNVMLHGPSNGPRQD
jgi:hypothetical protein